MRQKKNNIQGIDAKANIIAIVILVIMRLFLLGSCSALFSSDTGNIQLIDMILHLVIIHITIQILLINIPIMLLIIQP